MSSDISEILKLPDKIYYKEDATIIVGVAVIHTTKGNRFLKQRL